MNNKQIMYDCDKGYILTEKGPVGATCVGGLWRPRELPECLPALHPRLRWNRRRRRQASQIQPYQLPIYSYRHFKRNVNDILQHHRAADDGIDLEQAISRQISLSNRLQQKRNAISEALARFRRRMPHKRLIHIDYNIPRALRNDRMMAYANQYRQHASNGASSAHRTMNRLPFELHGFQPPVNRSHANHLDEVLDMQRTKKTDIFIRAKRSMKDDDGSDSDKRSKAKEPCEVFGHFGAAILIANGGNLESSSKNVIGFEFFQLANYQSAIYSHRRGSRRTRSDQ